MFNVVSIEALACRNPLGRPSRPDATGAVSTFTRPGLRLFIGAVKKHHVGISVEKHLYKAVFVDKSGIVTIFDVPQVGWPFM